MADHKGKGRPSNNAAGLPNITQSPIDTFLRRYKVIEKIGEGSYSEVLKCRNRESGTLVACKRLKHVYRNWSQVNDIAEITTLRTLARHINILQMIEIHYDQRLGKVSLVFEIMEMNLYELIKDRKRLLPEARVRLLIFQLMKALRHLHKHGVFHRDIKPENILLRPKSDLLKLGDLGSVRGIYSRPPFTEYISTRWYRSPECLLTAGYYGFKMDVWAAGCVFFEILTLRPLFPGSSELDQINRIHNIMGPPPQRVLQRFYKQAELEKDSYRNRSQQNRWDGMRQVIDDVRSKFEFTEGKSKNFDWYFSGKESGGLDRVLPQHMSLDARDLVRMMLTYDPDARPTAHRVLQHGYFSDVRDLQGSEKESKCPIIAVFGDERGRQMISQHYAHVDLKTLGDKKHLQKRQRETRYTNLQKKPEVKVPSKKSSPILKGAGSPETPQTLAEGDIRKVVNPIKMSGIELLKKQNLEKQKEKLTKKPSESRIGVIGSDRSSAVGQDRPSLAGTVKPSLVGPDRPSLIGSVQSSTTNFSKNKNNKSVTNLDIYQTLDLDKQKRLSLRRKEEQNQMPAAQRKSKIPNPYTKYSVTEKAKVQPTKEKESVKQNATEVAANTLFPRNRFGVSLGDEYSANSANIKSLLTSRVLDHQPTVVDIYSARPDINKNFFNHRSFDLERKACMTKRHSNNFSVDPPVAKGSAFKLESATKAATRLGLSLPTEPADRDKDNSLFKKPPIPPLYRGAVIDRNENLLLNNEPTEPRSGIGQLLDNGALNISKIKGDQSKFKTKTKIGSMLGAPEAMKRRTERIRAKLRDDVYCSSDDDIVSNLRQKFDELISERARRFSESSCDTQIEKEDYEGNVSYRSKHERPRKYLRRNSISRAENPRVNQKYILH